MLAFLTILLMLIVAYAQFREGIFTALTVLINIVIAGVIAFNFWEPVADFLDPKLHGSFVGGWEDFFVLFILFSAALITLRIVTNNLAPTQIEFAATPNQFGGAFVGLCSGYLLAGFLTCMMQTLPWHEEFMGFAPRSSNEGPSRAFLPPDRVCLTMLRHLGAYPLASAEIDPGAKSPYDRYRTFDRGATFEQRYQRYRRYNNQRNAMPYQGELDGSLDRGS